MPLGLIIGIGRSMRRKRTSSLDILSSKRAPRDYYKGKNCKPTGFHTRKGGYVVVQEKLPNYVVPDLTNFKAMIYQIAQKHSPKDNLSLSSHEAHAFYVEVSLTLEQELIQISLSCLQLKAYVSQCPREVKTTEAAESAK
ncbi:hypothetical protein EZV62_021912 [Acer yangbiense]|uniref:Uncharacterized protein n=1 Tax=Acer yangbiense TaxID=1000413 RepID=A0A5C7H6N9_9ROSI|nr:hypothetical protein EZV62_021912 [Acer yangbiense]